MNAHELAEGARLRRHARRDAVTVIGVWSIALLLTVLTLTFALITEWWVMFFFGGNAAGAWMAVYKVERATLHPAVHEQRPMPPPCSYLPKETS